MDKLRNIAIIAHVDHGKTTLVDQLLRQSGTLSAKAAHTERIMDSNDLERERGITILAKNTAIHWRGWHINIVDTPGHADFGGEVERVLSMVDSVLLLVDAVDGPMPQTRFVTQKAFAMGFRPILVINKMDRPGARPDWVLDQTFDLFDRLRGTDSQLDFPTVYASALMGYASLDPAQPGQDMTPLFETIVRETPPPQVTLDAPFQMRISSLDYSSFVGVIGIGRIQQGRVRTNTPVAVIDPSLNVRPGRILKIFNFLGLERIETGEAVAGEIVAITGVERLGISDTLCHPDHVHPLPPLSVDEPTVSMTFQVNDSPLAGREGKYVTSRQLRDRLFRELTHNVALRVEETDNPDKFQVSGRGELHLGILIENMRREGYELAVSRPQVILKQEGEERLEPYEQLSVDVEEVHQGAIMEALGSRRGEITDMVPDGQGRVRLDYVIPARGLIGFLTEFRTLTSGSGIMHHVFLQYGPYLPQSLGSRRNGVLVSREEGRAVPFALFNLQDRGRMMVAPGEEIYQGMIVGIHSRDNDLAVNPMKTKQLTNIRAAGSDENVILTPPVRHSLEQAMEFINDDELVEITPKSIRLRKRFLKEHERKKEQRAKNK
ncbi:MAG: translational GTPase TypA [Magnetococcales bacterium]|nr:translational GTPase TypA [Magnetococcales bacterium]MBF0157144.1 translational GTPase TypA [Magnetococcales bacterium]